MSAPRPRARTVLTLLKLLVWAVIAAALVKLAFFPAAQALDAAQSLDPTASYGQMTVSAQKGSISSQIDLEGTIQPDPAPEIKATMDGQVTEIYVLDGQAVNQGDTILLIQKEMPGEDTETTDESGATTVVPGKSWWKSEWITAPATGTLDLSAMLDQQFSVGDVLGAVQPPTFSAVATLTADQMYRIQDVPDAATITIKDGPAPFDCSGLSITTPRTGQKTGGSSGAADGADTPDGGSSSSTSIEARCRIPDGQKVFPGLQVTMGITAGAADNVLTLPVTAVEGRFQTGVVYRPTGDPDNPEKVDVALGVTDGTTVEITGGLSEGEEVLEFVPGQEPQMTCDPMTGEGC
ncbi:biotin/lipoyl-binding protein [Schaalia naturae]|uniref:Biotin/lipoyl-binding protein n=1 Tax=Schaalia naturae TaxID=635203 RepID=A0ABW2SQ06_9ACTO